MNAQFRLTSAMKETVEVAAEQGTEVIPAERCKVASLVKMKQEVQMLAMSAVRCMAELYSTVTTTIPIVKTRQVSHESVILADDLWIYSEQGPFYASSNRNI